MDGKTTDHQYQTHPNRYTNKQQHTVQIPRFCTECGDKPIIISVHKPRLVSVQNVYTCMELCPIGTIGHYFE